MAKLGLVQLIWVAIIAVFVIRCSNSSTCYKVNVSTWFGPLELVEPIYGWIMPFLIFITLISNSLIILVLSR